MCCSRMLVAVPVKRLRSRVPLEVKAETRIPFGNDKQEMPSFMA